MTDTTPIIDDTYTRIIRADGLQAAVKGRSALTCPFRVGTREQRIWLDGFTVGRQSIRPDGSDGVERREFGVLRGGRAGNRAGSRAT